MKDLKTKHIKIAKEQWLSDIEEINPLPTNAIYNKKIPALGATHAVIIAKMHCFLLEPNVPVIQGKVEEHNSKPENKCKQILGVHKGIYKDDILKYLTSNAEYKKILCTPEGFRDKILPVIKDNLDFYKKNFYILIDECEKNIQDSSYRGKINAPFDVFFEFENKGLISATPLEFSDPRFHKFGFTKYVIQPDYSFTKPLELINTNSVLDAFNDYIKENLADQYCIFVNSTNAIEAIIKQMNIKMESSVFCADESVDKLLSKDLPIARSNFNVKHMKKYNFFTSRYFSAFDIKLQTKPNVVMITDVYFAKHSILDPHTEVIQIAGRLRNGINKITHITNLNPKMKWMQDQEAVTYLHGIKAMFAGIIKLASEMPHKGRVDFLEQIKQVDLAKFFKDDGSFDWFMFDNFKHEERVKGYYQSLKNLESAYELVSDHFTIIQNPKYYTLGDEDRLKRDSTESRKALLKELAMQLRSIDDSPYHYDKPRAIKYIRNISEVLVDGYNALGLEGLDKTNYLEKRIKAATEKKKQSDLFSHPHTRLLIYKHLEVKENSKGRYKDSVIVDTLGRIYNKVGIKKHVYASDVIIFFDATRTTVENEKGYLLISRKFK